MKNFFEKSLKKFFEKNLLVIFAVILTAFIFSYSYADSAAGVLRVTRGGTGVENITEGQFLIGKNIDEMQATSSISMDSAGNVVITKGLTVASMGITGVFTENLALDDHYISNDGDNEGIRILDNGNVGIASTAPAHELAVGGSINISGDYMVNETAIDVFPAGYIFSHTATNSPVLVAGTWVDVEYDGNGLDKNITHSTTTNPHQFTVTKAGVYEISWHIAAVDSQANPAGILNTRATVGGTEIEGSVAQKDFTNQNSNLTIHHQVLADLSADDVIVTQFTSGDTTVALSPSTDYGDHHDSATIIIQRID